MTSKTAPDMDISVRISATHHEPSRGQLFKILNIHVSHGV